MEGQNTMRKINILVRVLLVIAASIYFIQNAKADCGHSLWNLLASRSGVEATAWTTAEFRAEATVVAKRLGMVYDQSSKGNLALIEALCTEKTLMSEEGLKGAPIGEAIASEGSILPIHQFVEDWVNFSVVFNVHMGPDTIVSTDTIWHWEPIVVDSILVSPFEGNEPCIETIETIPTDAAVACTLCDRGIETNSLREQWGVYMKLGEMLRSPKALDRATRRHLADCRIEIGRRCRPYHISVHPSAGGQQGLSQARSSRFFKAIGKAFSSIGACKRS